MAFALTRALGRMRLTSSAPSVLRFPARVIAAPRPCFSFANSVGGRSVQGLEARPVSFVAFASTTHCSKSAEKRHRQSEKRRMRNKSRKSEIKTRMKKVFRALGEFKDEDPKDMAELEPVEPLMRQAFKAIDKAVQKGTLHRNTGARRKSRLARAKLRLLEKAGFIAPVEKPKPLSLVAQYEARKQAKRAALKELIQQQLAGQEA